MGDIMHSRIDTSGRFLEGPKHLAGDALDAKDRSLLHWLYLGDVLSFLWVGTEFSRDVQYLDIDGIWGYTHHVDGLYNQNTFRTQRLSFRNTLS